MTTVDRDTTSAEYAPPAEARLAYVNQVVVSYSFYLVGAVTAFVAAALALTDSQAGLHSSAMAVGIGVAGLFGDRFDHWFGQRAMKFTGMGLLAVALILVAWAPALVVTMVGAGSVGLGAGLSFGHVTQTLGAGGGTRARLQLTRAALVAKVSQLFVPLVIAAGIAIGVGWQLVIVPVLVFVGFLFVSLLRRPRRSLGASAVFHRLPRAYWLPWTLVVMVVAIEFAVIFWGSTLVDQQTGVSLADATLAISVFIAGLIMGRAALSIPALGRFDPILVIRAGIVLTIAAVMLPWLTTSYEISAVGLLIAGLGIGVLYPLAASIALGAAPDHPAAASARLVFAAGLAILVAPLLLGVIADLRGITAGWLLVPGLGFGALLLSVQVAKAHTRRQALPATPAPPAS
ncbi:MAG: sugar MFS transporter [Chloroflexota bacterium]